MTLCSTLVISLIVTLGSDWPQWGGPSRDFVAPAMPLAESWPTEGPTIRWEVPVGDGYSGVVVRDDMVFTAYREGDSDIVIAVRAGDGQEIWRHQDRCPTPDFVVRDYGTGPHSTPLVTDDLVVFIGFTGNMIALDRTTGERRWMVQLWDDMGGTRVERGYAASPILVNDMIIVPVGGTDQAVVAFREADGQAVWSAASGRATYASPVLLTVNGMTQVCVHLEDALVGLDPENGTLLWETPINSERYAICTTPVVGPGSQIMTLGRDGAEMFRVSADAGGAHEIRRVWQSRRIGSQDHNLVRRGNQIVGSNESATFSILDAMTGEVMFRTRDNADASIIVVGNRFLTISEGGELALSRYQGGRLEITARHQLMNTRTWAAPALVGSTLYIRDLERLIAVDLTPAVANVR